MGGFRPHSRSHVLNLNHCHLHRSTGDRRVPRAQMGRELEYRLIKEVWAHTGSRIAVRFAYEWRNASGHWFRSHGNEQWEFDESGLMRRREASINDVAIAEAARLYRWPLGPGPSDHPGLRELML